jgi:hypothetical protein
MAEGADGNYDAWEEEGCFEEVVLVDGGGEDCACCASQEDLDPSAHPVVAEAENSSQRKVA